MNHAPDLDFAKLRCFVAVAELRHFARAASALHVSQPTLSRQIQRLESELGVPLVLRTTRSVDLSPAGHAFLQDAKDILAAGESAVNRARHINAPTGRLRVGFGPHVDVSAAINAFTVQRPEISVELIHMTGFRQDTLTDRAVDVGFVRLPLAPPGLETVPLYEEGLTAVLPADHRLAEHRAVSLADLAGEVILRPQRPPRAWQETWHPLPEGTPAEGGPSFHYTEELLTYVASGRGIATAPASLATEFPRPTVSYVKVADVLPGNVALVWDKRSASRTTKDFIASVKVVFGVR